MLYKILLSNGLCYQIDPMLHIFRLESVTEHAVNLIASDLQPF